MNPTSGHPTALTRHISRRTFLVGASVASAAAVIGTQIAPNAAFAAVIWNHPLEFRGTISRPYGYDASYTEYDDRFHKGIDYDVASGTPVHPVAAGVVIDAGWGAGGQSWSGNSILVEHAGGVRSFYAHLSETHVAAGAAVSPTTVLGKSGNTGSPSTGPHLHLEIWQGATRDLRTDPQPLVHNAPLPQNAAGGNLPPASNLGEVGIYPSGWRYASTGAQLPSTLISAVDTGRGWAEVYVADGQTLKVVLVNGTRWELLNTGVALNPTSISAVVMNGGVHVWAVENNTLVVVFATSSGWVKQNSGLAVGAGAKISAVVVDGGQINIMESSGGYLYQIWPGSTWQRGGTGVQVGSEFEAVYLGSGAPQVMTLLGGTIQQIWAGDGWQRMSTGVAAGGTLSAVYAGGGFPVVYTAEGGYLYETAVRGGAWSRMGTGAEARGVIRAARIGGANTRIYTTG